MADAKLPTREEVEKLPRWAHVAFLARCARRALLLVRKRRPNERLDSLAQEDIETAERVAAAPTHGHLLPRHPAASERRKGNYPSHRQRVDPTSLDRMARAGHDARDVAARHAAVRACHAAGRAYEDAKTDADAAAHPEAYTTIDIDSGGATFAALAGVPVSSIARDFECIRGRAAKERWTDNTPVSPEVFGPLDEPEPAPPEREVTFQELQAAIDWTYRLRPPN